MSTGCGSPPLLLRANEVRRILSYLRAHETDIRGIARALSMSMEDATTAVVRLEALGLIRMKMICCHGETPMRYWTCITH